MHVYIHRSAKSSSKVGVTKGRRVLARSVPTHTKPFKRGSHKVLIERKSERERE
jgi:hypothetical protein